MYGRTYRQTDRGKTFYNVPLTPGGGGCIKTHINWHPIH